MTRELQQSAILDPGSTRTKRKGRMLEVGCDPDTLATNYRTMFHIVFTLAGSPYSTTFWAWQEAMMNVVMIFVDGPFFEAKKMHPPFHQSLKIIPFNLVQPIFFKCPSRSITKNPSPSSSLFHVKVAGSKQKHIDKTSFQITLDRFSERPFPPYHISPSTLMGSRLLPHDLPLINLLSIETLKSS